MEVNKPCLGCNRQAQFQTVPSNAERVAMTRQPQTKLPAVARSFASSPARRVRLWLILASLSLATAAPYADDWPEFRGPGRRGVWNETGILDRFPEGGLRVLWRTPVKAGYSGPAVAGG